MIEIQKTSKLPAFMWNLCIYMCCYIVYHVIFQAIPFYFYLHVPYVELSQ